MYLYSVNNKYNINNLKLKIMTTIKYYVDANRQITFPSYVLKVEYRIVRHAFGDIQVLYECVELPSKNKNDFINFLEDLFLQDDSPLNCYASQGDLEAQNNL